MAKLTNHVQRTRLITPSTDKHYSLDSEDDFRSGCRNVSHQEQFFSKLLSPGRSHNTNNLPKLACFIQQCSIAVATHVQYSTVRVCANVSQNVSQNFRKLDFTINKTTKVSQCIYTLYLAY